MASISRNGAYFFTLTPYDCAPLLTAGG